MAETENAPSTAQWTNWLKRIAKALSLSNIVTICAVVIGVPGGILAWNQWADSAKKDQLDREAAARAERVAQAEEIQANAILGIANRPAENKEPAPKQSEVREPTPAQAPPSRVIVQAPPAGNDAELSRPYVTITNWSLQKVVLGEGAEWVVTMENSGRPAMVSMTDYQVFYEADEPTGFPTCADTITYGGTHPMKGPQRALLRASKPVDQAGWDAYQKGVPLMLVATYCYKDDVTKRQHITHVCLKGYASGVVQQCRRGNEVN